MNWYIILFFLIGICLFAITQYLRTKKENQIETEQEYLEELEYFQSENALSPADKLSKYHNLIIDFKNANEARKLFTNTKNNNNTEYLQKMNQPNLLARGCSSRDELYNKYLDAFDDITEKERASVNSFILDLLDTIKERNVAYYKYLLNWIRKISIAKAKPWLEAGMPHTLENTIIMDADWFSNPRSTTFVHELTHVNQRQVVFEFEDLYKDLGYFEYSPGVEKIRGMGSIVALNRNNPDGLSYNWLWCNKSIDTLLPNMNFSGNTFWWIGAIFQNITPSRLTDVSNVALKLERGSDGTFYYLKQQPTLLDTLGEFNSFFGGNPNNYHPNEMTAKFSEWYLEYVLGKSGSKYENYEGFKIYKKHFENLIKSFY